MLWIARLEEAPERLDQPIAWIAAHAEAALWPLPSPTREDLADAALAKRDGGAPRLLRRRMLRALVARVFARHPQSFGFTRSAYGAPELDGVAAFISTSGCQGWSAVALAPAPIGIDIEPTREAADLPRWTLHEAVQKAHGQGLGADAASTGRSWVTSQADFIATVATL